MTTPCQKTLRALSPRQNTPIPTNAAAHLCTECVRTKKAVDPIRQAPLSPRLGPMRHAGRRRQPSRRRRR